MKFSRSAQVRHFFSVSRTVAWTYRNTSPTVFRQLIAGHRDAYKRSLQARNDYTTLSESDLLARKKSDRIFVIGCGSSLNEIQGETWKRFAEYDSIGFNGAFYQHWLPLTFFILRAWSEDAIGGLAWHKDCIEVQSAIEANRCLDETLFCFPDGVTSIFTNRLVGHKMWNDRHPLFYYLPDKLSRYPHQNIREGLVHRAGTLASTISLAVALGYREIVLVGIDLYDNRYFWLPPDKTFGWLETEQMSGESDTTARGLEVEMQHNTASNGIVEIIGQWDKHLRATSGQKISVFNPRSLMARTVPIFTWPEN